MSTTSSSSDSTSSDKLNLQQDDNLPQGKYLLLLDINGTLCHRMVKRAVNRERNDFRYKIYHVYRRPGLATFVEYLDSNLCSSIFDVYVYTSIMQHNAEGMIKRLLIRPEHAHFQKRIFDRSWNKRRLSEPDELNVGDTKKNTRKEETVRNLHKIWKKLPQYNATNTIILDNSPDKCEEYEDNAIIIPPFVDEENLTVGDDDSLTEIQQYLTQLSKEQPKDVRRYLKDHPFNTLSEEAGITKQEPETEIESNIISDLSSIKLDGFATCVKNEEKVPSKPSQEKSTCNDSPKKLDQLANIAANGEKVPSRSPQEKSICNDSPNKLDQLANITANEEKVPSKSPQKESTCNDSPNKLDQLANITANEEKAPSKSPQKESICDDSAYKLAQLVTVALSEAKLSSESSQKNSEAVDECAQELAELEFEGSSS